jgi:hypothetical protein
MLRTIGIVLLAVWLLGLVVGVTLSGFIHILLVVAVAALLLNEVESLRPYDF